MLRIVSVLLTLCMFVGNAYAAGQNTYDLESEIYPKLSGVRCTIPLAGHDCHEARVMKAYIEGLKDAGASKEDIFLKVAKKFSVNTILDQQIKAQVEKEVVKDLDNKRPQIAIEPAVFDFGKISKMQGIVTHIFTINNKGNSDLIINNIYPACPCTIASLRIDDYKSPYFNTSGASKGWQVKLPPGKTADLEVIFDVNKENLKIGNVSRKILIISNDPLYSSINVEITAEVQD